MKIKRGLKHVILLVTVFHLSYSDQNSTNLVSRRQKLEKQAVEGYQNACLKLQKLTFWTSALFKIKSAWKSSTANQLARSYQISPASDDSSMPMRPKRGESGEECSAMRNVYVMAQNYVQMQILKLRLKAVLGNRLLQTSRFKLDDATVSLKEGIKSLDALTSVSRDMLNKLKYERRKLTSSFDRQESEELGEIPQSRSSTTHKSSQEEEHGISLPEPEALELKQNLQNVESLSQAGSFFENLGRILDSYLFAKNIKAPVLVSKK